MNVPTDIRWKQRFQNYTQALQTIRRAIALSKQRELSKLEQQGLIKGFEFTHELAWNVLEDYLQHQGISDLIGSRDAARAAFKNGLVEDGDAWMDMIKARNQTTHTDNIAVAQIIVTDIFTRFFPAFVALETRFQALRQQSE